MTRLRLFEAAGRHLSFKRAADELGVTPSAVSHGIQELEDWLGTRLFARGRPGLAFTEAGAGYFPAVRDALLLIATAGNRLPGRAASDRIRISVAPTFAARLLLPRLPRFRERHPDVSVVLDTAHEAVDVPRDDADLAIRMGRGDWPGLAAEHLLTEHLVPLCTPALKARLGEERDFRRLPLIHVTTVSRDWQAWSAATGIGPIHGDGGLKVDEIQMAADAAVAGLGLVLGRRPLMDAELAAGTLVPFCDRAVASDTGYWLVGLAETMARPTIRAFAAWLRGALAELRQTA